MTAFNASLAWADLRPRTLSPAFEASLFASRYVPSSKLWGGAKIDPSIAAALASKEPKSYKTCPDCKTPEACALIGRKRLPPVRSHKPSGERSEQEG